MNRKATEAYPPSYYDLFEDLQADMHRWAADGRIGHEEFQLMHVEWNPRLWNAERDAYKESGASYRRRHLNKSMD